MNAATIFLFAGIGGVFAFGREIVQIVVKTVRGSSATRREAAKEPLELHSMVIENTKEALALQGAAMVELRLVIEEERKESALKDVRISEWRRRYEDVKTERDQLIVELAQYKR